MIAKSIATAFSIGVLSLILSGPIAAATPQQQPDLTKSFMATDLVGMDVRNNQGDDLGKISNLIVDPNGQIAFVVLEEGGVGGLGAHKYSVPFDRVQLSKATNVAIVNVPKDQISSEFSAFEEAPSQPQKEEGPQFPGSDSSTEYPLP